MRGWVSLLIAIALIPFLISEALRFYDAYYECDERFISNWRLYTNAVCMDPVQRRTLGEKQDRACSEAEEQNRLPPVYCAWRRMWYDGAVYHVWHMLAYSYWMQFGLAVIVIVTTFGLTAWLCNQRSHRNWTGDMLIQLQQHQQQQHHQPISDGYAVPRLYHKRNEY
jgi:hypothetical protein